MLITATHQLNQDVMVSFDKEALKQLPSVMTHPILSNEANWKMVSVIFKHNLSNKRLASGFKNNFTKTDNVKVKSNMLGGEIYELHEIIISGTNRQPRLSIKRSEIADAALMDLILVGENTVSPVTATISTISNSVNGPFEMSVSFSESIVGLELSDFLTTNVSLSNLSGSGTSYTLTATPSLDGSVSIQLPSNKTSASNGAQNNASNTLSIVYYAPVSASLSTVSNEVNSAFLVTATFDKSVTNFELSDISITNGAASNLSGSGSSYSFTVTPSSDGNVLVSIPQGSVNAAGGATNNASNQLSVQYAANASVILSTPSNSIESQTFEVTATFDKSVVGFTLEDIVITNGVASNLMGSNDVYTFTVTANEEGPTTVVIPASSVSTLYNTTNNDSNTLSVTFALNTNVTLYVDFLVQHEPFWVLATFDKPVTNFSAEDLYVSGGMPSNLSGSGSNYTFKITPWADMMVEIKVMSGMVVAPHGKTNEESNNLLIRYDQNASVQISTSDIVFADLGDFVYGPFDVNVQFSKPVTGLALEDIAVTNGIAYNLDSSASGSGSYTFTVYPSTDGPVSVYIPQFSVSTQFNGTNDESNTISAYYASPISAFIDEVNGESQVSGPFNVFVEFSKPVSNFTLSDISVTNGTASNIVGTGNEYEFTVTPITDYQDVIVQISAASVYGSNNETNSASNELFVLYREAKTLTLSKTGNGSIKGYLDGELKLAANSSYNFLSNDYPSIIATSDLGNYFNGYTGDVTSSNNNINVLMDSNKSISGSFSESFNDVGGLISGGRAGSVTQPDGKIIIYGSFLDLRFNDLSAANIIRINADGTVDETFNTGTGFDNAVNTVAIDSSGNIWVGGAFTSYNGPSNNANRIAKLSPTGELLQIEASDTASVTGNGFNSSVRKIIFDSSNNIWVCGDFNSYKGEANNANYIAKLNSSGALQKINIDDTSTTTGNGFNGLVFEVIIDSSNNIWAGGTFTSYKGVANNANYIAKLNSSGVLQKINSTDTNISTGNGFNNAVYTIRADSSGNTWVGGTFTSYKGITNSANRIAKLDSSGALQKINSADTNSNLGNGLNNTVESIKIDSNGSIWAVGSFTAYKGLTTGSNRIIKINASTGLQESLHSSNTAGATSNGFTGGTVYDINFHGPNDVIIGGNMNAYCESVSVNHYANAIVALKNVSGNYTKNHSLLAFSKKASSFDASVMDVRSSVNQPDGKMIVCGNFAIYDNNGNIYTNIARFNTDGSIDQTFVVGSGFNDTVRAVVLDSSNNIWVGGDFTSYQGVANNANRIAKLNSAGVLQKINSADTNTSTGNGFNGTIIYTVFIDSSNNVWVGGNFTSYKGTANNANYIAKLDSSGVLQKINSADTNTGTGNGFNNGVYTIRADSSGNIWAGGGFTSYKGTANNANRIAKLDSSGVLQKINSADTNTSTGNGFNNAVNIIRFNSGNVWVGGTFTSYKGVANNANGLIKLDSSGVLQKINSADTDTSNGNGFGSHVNTIRFDSSNNIWVGGNFTSYKGASAVRIAKLDSSGTLQKIDPADGTTLRSNGFDGIVYNILNGNDGSMWINGSFKTCFIGSNPVACKGLIKLYDGSSLKIR